MLARPSPPSHTKPAARAYPKDVELPLVDASELAERLVGALVAAGTGFLVAGDLHVSVFERTEGGGVSARAGKTSGHKHRTRRSKGGMLCVSSACLVTLV